MTQTIHRAMLRRVWGASARARHFEFEVTEERHFEFHSGQFITLRVPSNGNRTAYAYSIATAHREDHCFELCLNVPSEGGIVSWWQGLKTGDVIEFTGPYGAFRLRRPPDRVSAFIATGTGIAPIRAMLQELYRKYRPEEAWLIFGVRKESDILYREEFEDLARRNSTFHFIPTLSRPGPGWRGPAGYVQEQIKKHLAGQKGLHAYVSGAPEIVEDVRRLLRRMGYAPEAVSCEKLE